MKARGILWVPFALFAVLAAAFWWGLHRPENGAVPSRMVGQPVPSFALPAAASDRPALTSLAFSKGQPRLLNIFASWCVPCAAEASQLRALAAAGVPIDGIAIRDARADVDDFLRRWGNPYSHIGLDARSQVQIEIGSSGVPETFLIDGKGRIVAQHIGPLSDADVPEMIRQWKAAR